MTRDEITQRKMRRYRRIWGLFLQLPTREVARREGVTVNRVHQIVTMYARIRHYPLWRQFPDPVLGETWAMRYGYTRAVDYRVTK